MQRQGASSYSLDVEELAQSLGLYVHPQSYIRKSQERFLRVLQVLFGVSRTELRRDLFESRDIL
jgi:hypothetical protein